MGTTVTFLGTGAHLPAAGRDTASFLINGRVLFDCGWAAALRLLRFGHSANDVETLFFTHCHPDHYMGLPGLMYYRGMSGEPGRVRSPLRVAGPADDLPRVLNLAERFMQPERFRRAWSPLESFPLEPGQSYEEADFRIDTIPALHGVTGFSGRFADLRTGVVIAFSGDTAPNPGLVELARGADLLIHEAALAPEVPEAPARGGHSRAADAARIARDAGVGALRLVHLYGGHDDASLAAARAVFPEAQLARDGETLTFPRR